VVDLKKSFDETLRYFRPDVVITQLDHAIDLAQHSHSRGVPAVVYLHDINFGILGQRTTNVYSIKFLSNSKFTSKKFLEMFGLQSTIVYNLFNPERYYAKLSEKHVTFINPHPKKGGKIAFSLAEKNPDIPFLFVGSWLGPPEKNYKRRAKAAGNIDWVASTPDMSDIYRKTYILIAPTCIDEAWGRVVTEAQFSGIPVLASNRGGLPESVGEGGILLPDDDLESWQIALEDLWSNQQRWRQLSKSALQHASRPEIQQSTIIGQFVELLEQIRVKEPLAS
jgi:glycosyltransferase involved in cell wall biosynthesis